MELRSESEEAMLRFLAENLKGREGVHSYSVEAFGLHADTEDRRFQFYTDFFGVESERL